MNRCFSYDEPCNGQRGCSVTGKEKDEVDEVDEEEFIASGNWRGKHNSLRRCRLLGLHGPRGVRDIKV